jgi:hypothetical protein
MLIRITSANPNLSWCVNKNPETCKDKPFEKPLRKGKVYSWFPAPDAYSLLFLDAEVETSFTGGTGGEFEYLDLTRYSAPQTALAMISEVLKEPLKNRAEADVPSSTTIRLNIIAGVKELEMAIDSLSCNGVIITKTSLLSAATHGSPYFDFVCPVDVIVTATTLHAALNALCTLLLFQCIKDQDCDLGWNRALLLKYADILVRAQAPAMSRQRFITSLAQDRETSTLLADRLAMPGVVYAYGRTNVQRADAILDVLRGGYVGKVSSVVDLGCGEGYNLQKLVASKGYTSAVAVDRCEESWGPRTKAVLEKAEVTYVQAEITPEWVTENLSLLEGRDVLMAEFLEHNPLAVATSVLSQVLQSEARTVVCTVPNRGFNKYYHGMAEGAVRHPEHEWEPNLLEWQAFLMKALDGIDRTLHTYDVGTVIQGQPVSFMAVFSPAGEASVPTRSLKPSQCLFKAPPGDVPATTAQTCSPAPALMSVTP